MKKLTTAIFDMDGVLIDSEPFWRVAEKQVFKEENVDITDEMCLDVQGLKAEHVVEKWVAMFPNLKYSVLDYTNKIQDLVAQQISDKGMAMTGIIDALKYLKSKEFKIVLASSSCYQLIDTVIDKLNIRNYFDVIHSSQDEKLGKPFPDVFLHAAERVGSMPDECVVIEDSCNGVRAGKAAKMSVIAIPAKNNFDNPIFDIADWKLKTANEIKKIIY